MAQLSPYLSFQSNAREAMTFYQACFGGELVIQIVSEMPEMAVQMPPEMRDAVLHSSLTSGNLVILASDLNRFEPQEGNTIHLCVNCETEDELNNFFSKMSEGGKILQPVGDMPWGAKYGELIDKYGKGWMFNYQKG